ncbi:MAG TPA: mechanosensitive ion channel domain-containing protein [Methanomassiliicoccales archaeon]|jgi:small-conductance mechanosensitive channel
MLHGLSNVPLAIGDDLLNTYGWPLLFVAAMFVVSLYVWSYVTKAFDRMATKEGKYLDSEVVYFLDHMVKTVIVILLSFMSGYVASLVWQEFKDQVWTPYFNVIVDVIIIAVIVLVAMLIVHILRRIAKQERMARREVTAFGRSNKEMTSLVMSYVVYLIAVTLTLIIIITLIPTLNPYEAASQFLNKNGTVVGTIIVIIVAIFLVMRLIGEVLEDFKYRTKKFNPQVIDLFRTVIGYSLWTIAFLTIVFSVFSLFNLSEIGLILVILIMSVILVGVSLSYSTIRNIYAGLAIMDSSPFEIGDRINIGGDMECDVLQKNLMFTEVKTMEGDFVDFPNIRIIEDKIYNYSRSVAHAITVRLEVDFSISHNEVEKLIRDAMAKVQGIMKDQAAEVIATGIEKGTIQYEVRVYIEDGLKARQLRSELIFRIQDAFHASGHEALFE